MDRESEAVTVAVHGAESVIQSAPSTNLSDHRATSSDLLNEPIDCFAIRALTSRGYSPAV